MSLVRLIPKNFAFASTGNVSIMTLLNIKKTTYALVVFRPSEDKYKPYERKFGELSIAFPDVSFCLANKTDLKDVISKATTTTTQITSYPTIIFYSVKEDPNYLFPVSIMKFINYDNCNEIEDFLITMVNKSRPQLNHHLNKQPLTQASGLYTSGKPSYTPSHSALISNNNNNISFELSKLYNTKRDINYIHNTNQQHIDFINKRDAIGSGVSLTGPHANNYGIVNYHLVNEFAFRHKELKFEEWDDFTPINKPYIHE